MFTTTVTNPVSLFSETYIFFLNISKLFCELGTKFLETQDLDSSLYKSLLYIIFLEEESHESTAIKSGRKIFGKI